MRRPYQFISFQTIGDVFCVRLQSARIEDHLPDELSAEIARLIDEENCRKMVVNLGPDEPGCLISVFLAKLIILQRRLQDIGGALNLANTSADTRNIFRIAGIEKYFHFYADQASAVQALSGPDLSALRSEANK